MINITALTTALYDRLVGYAPLAGLNCSIARSTRINFDPSITPWVGVYPGNISTRPRAMGGKSWDNSVELQIIAQASSLTLDGTAASDILEDVIEKIHAAINSDLTLGVVGVRVTGTSREYRYVVFDSEGDGDLFMPQAIIKVVIEMRS